MIGFLIGAVSLVGLVRTIRHGHPFGGHGACGGGHHHGHFGGFSGRGFSRMRGIFSRLDTSPGQEKAIRAAVDELRDAMRRSRDEAKELKRSLAGALRGETFDESTYGEATSRMTALFDEGRQAVLAALSKVHAALDERQRAMLADMVDAGPFGGFGGYGGGGPYRGAGRGCA